MIRLLYYIIVHLGYNKSPIFFVSVPFLLVQIEFFYYLFLVANFLFAAATTIGRTALRAKQPEVLAALSATRRLLWFPYVLHHLLCQQ